jgi:hypothetical protein
MKNIHDVMRQKELEIERLKKEIEALHTVAPMLGDEEPTPAQGHRTYFVTRNGKSRSAPPNTGTETTETPHVVALADFNG